MTQAMWDPKCECGCGQSLTRDAHVSDDGREWASYECWLDHQVSRAEKMRDAREDR